MTVCILTEFLEGQYEAYKLEVMSTTQKARVSYNQL